MNLKKYFAELKKRHVFKAGLAYLAGSWVFTEVADLVLDSFDAPPYFMKTILVVLAIGFPIWLIFSWVYDLTPDGLKKTDSKNPQTSESPRIDRRISRVIIGMLSVAIVLLVVNQFRNSPGKLATSEKKAFSRLAEDGDSSIENIAVLPFFNTRSDPETDYLGFAMADQIIGGLVYLQNIMVRPSGSIRRYEQQTIDPKQVGNDLQVDYLLLGNYLKEANTIRLNVELINVNTNRIIWREPIEVDFQSAFELQDIVAREVIESMNVQFTQNELNRMNKDIPGNPLAYEYYLRSISYPYTNEGDHLAMEMLEQSIALDSAYAPAHAQLGDRLHRLAQYGLLNPEETKRAEASYLRALSINGELISALANLAQIYAETARTDEAVEFTERLLEINPNNAEAHFSLGYIYRYAGLNQEAIREMEKAISLDPDNQGFRSIIITYLFAGDFEKAVEAGHMFQESAFILGIQGRALFQLDRKSEAMEYFDRVVVLEPGKLAALTAQMVRAFIVGNIGEGITAGLKIEASNLADSEAWYFTAASYGLLNDRDGCIRCLKRAVEGGFFNYPLMLRDPFLDSVRENPEFQSILELARRKHVSFKERYL